MAKAFFIKEGKEIRTVVGVLSEYIDLDYQNATLEELQILAAYAIESALSNSHEFKEFTEFKKYKKSDFLLYRGGHHIKLVLKGVDKDLGLFAIFETPHPSYTETYAPGQKDIPLDGIFI